MDVDEPPNNSWFPIQKNEWMPVFFSFAWFFLVLFSYQILRPIRESLFVELKQSETKWLFAATFVVMILAVPIYGKLVSTVGRRQLVWTIINFFTLNIIGFAFWISLGGGLMLSRCYFVWVSVFSLYTTSLVWSVIIDIFSNEQAKRLFGWIASGATLGAICGSSVGMAAKSIGTSYLLIVSAISLELCLVFAIALEKSTRNWESQKKPQPIQPGMLDGLKTIVNSKYLLMIIIYMSLISYFGTTIYLQLTTAVQTAFESREDRTAYFASLNLFVQIGTLVVQFLIVGPVMRWLGLAVSLTTLPIVATVCFTTMSQMASLTVLSCVDVVSRITTYGFSVPSREVLFTVVSREAKYKAKNAMDTIVIRGADWIASTTFRWMSSLTSFSTICRLMLPLILIWFLISFWLGREQRRLANNRAND